MTLKDFETTVVDACRQVASSAFEREFLSYTLTLGADTSREWPIASQLDSRSTGSHRVIIIIRQRETPMQKAIIIQQLSRDRSSLDLLDSTELNAHLAKGWRFVSAVPFGISLSGESETGDGSGAAAILVIIEKPNG